MGMVVGVQSVVIAVVSALVAMSGPNALAFADLHVVELIGLEFVARDITIRVGDTVRWVWVSGFHNVESGVIVDGNGVPDGNFTSGSPVPPPETYELVFDQAFLDAKPMPDDVYPYYCIVHTAQDMAGTIKVVDCLQDADCDDGLFCNGAETCGDNACLAGSAPCQDGEECDEDADECVGGCVRDPEWQCDGDVDGDGQVNPVDSGLVQAAFGSADSQDLCNYDIDCDGQINPVDSGIVQSLFGNCNAPRDACP